MIGKKRLPMHTNAMQPKTKRNRCDDGVAAEKGDCRCSSLHAARAWSGVNPRLAASLCGRRLVLASPLHACFLEGFSRVCAHQRKRGRRTCLAGRHGCSANTHLGGRTGANGMFVARMTLGNPLSCFWVAARLSGTSPSLFPSTLCPLPPLFPFSFSFCFFSGGRRRRRRVPEPRNSFCVYHHQNQNKKHTHTQAFGTPPPTVVSSLPSTTNHFPPPPSPIPSVPPLLCRSSGLVFPESPRVRSLCTLLREEKGS